MTNPTEALTLSSRYSSLSEIIKDPKGKGLAYAMDMSYTDWLNFQIKSFIILQRVMNQPVSLLMDGELTPLNHPDTNQPLLYSDFITDRSGPKFAGYLNEKPGTEYLQGNASPEETKRLIELQKVKTQEYCLSNQLEIPDDASLNIALSVFLKKHQSQRKLSDFDLTARETNLLERAVVNKLCEKKLTAEEITQLKMNPKLATAIGKTAWQIGGEVNTGLIIEFLKAKEPFEQTYGQRVRHTMIYPSEPQYKKFGEEGYRSETAFNHMLIDGVGKMVRNQYLDFYKYLGEPPPVFFRPDSSGVPDTYYGVGIPFFEASIDSVDASGKIKLSTHKDVIEIGDIICDNSSIFGRVFNPSNNFKMICKQFAGLGLSPEAIQATQEKVSKPGMDQLQVYEATLKALVDHPEIKAELKDEGRQLINQYQRQHDFLESSLMAEEAGKKEGQSQLFKQEKNFGKLIGNVSDTAPFVLGMAKASTHDEDARTHFDILKLTTLISVTRWGINQTNHKEVSNTQSLVSAEQFKNSLNSRSYAGEPSSGIRQALKLNQISDEEAQLRLKDYQQGFQPVWETIQSNAPFFNLVAQYKEAKAALNASSKEARAEKLLDFNEAHTNLRAHLENLIQQQMPALSKKLNDFSENAQAKKEALDSIMDQLEEAIDFGVGRELKLSQKQQSSHATPPPTPLTPPTPPAPPPPAKVEYKSIGFFEKPATFPQELKPHVPHIYKKISGPKVLRALKEKILPKYGSEKTLEIAEQFSKWKAKNHKDYPAKEFRAWVVELRKAVKQEQKQSHDHGQSSQKPRQ